MLKCFICNLRSIDKLTFSRHTDRRKGLEGNWTIASCNHCNIDSLYPIPSEEELNMFYNSYYDDDIFLFQKHKHSRFPLLRKLYHQFTGDVDPRDFIIPSENAKILDYGCGGASYIQHFHEKGYDITGADVSSEVVTQSNLNGLNVVKVHDFNKIPLGSNCFDIVYLMQVFEHLRDPNTFLKELHRVTKIGGSVFISVPNARSIWRKIFKKNWISGYFAPFHLAHYGEKSIETLVIRHGFKVEKCFFNTPDSWFRLNIKAALYPKINTLDCHRSWIDSIPIKLILNFLLRILEIPIRNKDCMTLEIKKV